MLGLSSCAICCDTLFFRAAGEVTDELENILSESRSDFLDPFFSNFRLFFEGGATNANRSQPAKIIDFKNYKKLLYSI